MSSNRQRQRHSGRRRSSATSAASSLDSTSSVASSMSDIPGQQPQWSSSHTVYTASSTVPSEYARFEAVPGAPGDHDDNVQAFCEFAQLLGCPETFGGHEVERWRAHTLSHLGERWPKHSGCSFCSSRRFDCSGHGGDVRAAFHARSAHVWHHITRDGKLVQDLRPDYRLFRSMRDRGLISEGTLQETFEYAASVPNPDRPQEFMAPPQLQIIYGGDEVVPYSSPDSQSAWGRY